MPILNRIQRRSASGKLLLSVFYALLIFGSAWMVYPFLLMVSGSVKSEVDSRQMDIIPKFLLNEEALYKKFLEQRYGRVDIALATTRAKDAEGNRLYSFESFRLPEVPSGKAASDWDQFLKIARPYWPYYYESMGHLHGVRAVPEVSYRYMRAIHRAFPNTPLAELNGTLTPEEWYSRNYLPPQEPNATVYWNMRENLPARYFYPVSIEGVFALHEVEAHYGSGGDALQKLNQEWGTHYASLMNVELKPSLPDNPAERKIWSEFVRNYLSARYIDFSPDLLPRYQEFLKTKYGKISALNAAHKTYYQDWKNARFPGTEAVEVPLNDLTTFLGGLTDLSKVSIRSPDFEWRGFLREKYQNDINALNAAWETHYQSFGEIPLLTAWQDLKILRENRSAIIWDYLTRNYRFAWSQIVMNSNGLRNTVIFCLLNVLTALIVNPLAAYALSRFQPRWGSIVLFILMATMAFPVEVTQIPSFLLLRDLGWLNTFAALVIPAAANGYSIFLLKGFFDSLPHDLYEAASLDGCGELRSFFTITVPLSGPILAVVALGAFTSAYGAFMFALLVCQKESMWTLMVYIYQLQQSYNSPVTFAALIIAAIPTLIVFVFCQNIILKGIVVPVEK